MFPKDSPALHKGFCLLLFLLLGEPPPLALNFSLTESAQHRGSPTAAPWVVS